MQADKDTPNEITEMATNGRQRDCITQEEKQEIMEGNIQMTSRQKITFRNLLDSDMPVSNNEDMDSGAATDGIGEGKRHRSPRNAQAVSMDSGRSPQEHEHSDERSTEYSEVFPGAVRIAGVSATNPENAIDDSVVHQDGDETHAESQNRSLSRVPVEALLVPEIHDIDLIVNERVNREVQERLNQLINEDTIQRQSEERHAVVAAEVVVKRRICFIPRSIFFGILAMAILAAVAIGASVAVVRSNTSRTELSATTSPKSGSVTSIPNGSLTRKPSGALSMALRFEPSWNPSFKPSLQNSTPSRITTLRPSPTPFKPSLQPSVRPSRIPTLRPSPNPTSKPTQLLTLLQSYVLNAVQQGATIASLVSSDVSSSTLTGQIPSQIGSLTRLTNLALSGNRLTGPIPSEIGYLTGLTFLDLDFTRLTGTIPSEVGFLTSLTSLYLYGNNLRGSMPSDIGSLTVLTDLVLYANSLTGTIPSQYGRLQALVGVDFHSNLLTGTVPTEFGSLPHLGVISIYNNSLTGSVQGIFCPQHVFGNFSFHKLPGPLGFTLTADCSKVKCSCCTSCN